MINRLNSSELKGEINKIINDEEKTEKVLQLIKVAQEVNKNELVDCLTELCSLKSVAYSDINKNISFDEDVKELRELEKKYPKLGISRYLTNDEGISILSIIATITDCLCSDRLGVVLNKVSPDQMLEDFEITAWQFINQD